MDCITWLRMEPPSLFLLGKFANISQCVGSDLPRAIRADILANVILAYYNSKSSIWCCISYLIKENRAWFLLHVTLKRSITLQTYVMYMQSQWENLIILDWYKWSCILLIVLFSDPVYLAPEVFLLDSELLTSEGTTRRRTLSSSDETELLNPPSSPNTDSWSLGVVLLQYLAVNLKYQSSCLDYCNCKVYEETLRSCTMMADNQQANLHWSERMPVIQS